MRLERLQQALAAQLKKPIASVFLPFEPDYTKMDYEAVREQEIDKLVDAGELRRGRIDPSLASRLSQILINQRTMLEAGVVEQKIAELEAAVQSSAVLPFKKRA